MNSKVFLKVRQREERMVRIKAFLIFPVAAFHLAIMSGRVRTDQFMLDTQLGGGFLKKGLDIPFTVGKTSGNSTLTDVASSFYFFLPLLFNFYCTPYRIHKKNKKCSIVKRSKVVYNPSVYG